MSDADLPGEGSYDNPVIMDPYQTIVEVHWPPSDISFDFHPSWTWDFHADVLCGGTDPIGGVGIEVNGTLSSIIIDVIRVPSTIRGTIFGMPTFPIVTTLVELDWIAIAANSSPFVAPPHWSKTGYVATIGYRAQPRGISHIECFGGHQYLWLNPGEEYDTANGFPPADFIPIDIDFSGVLIVHKQRVYKISRLETPSSLYFFGLSAEAYAYLPHGSIEMPTSPFAWNFNNPGGFSGASTLAWERGGDLGQFTITCKFDKRATEEMFPDA